jgi:uncharacterized protein YdcH (DUF465 family)
MLGMNLGMLVEVSVAVLLAVTIGYCVVLNGRLKRLHADRDRLAQMIGDLVQATALANNAVGELKKAAVEVDANLSERMNEAARYQSELAGQVAQGAQLVEKIARITAAARAHPLPEAGDEPAKPARMPEPAEPQSRLHSALQQLAMRPGIGGKAA